MSFAVAIFESAKKKEEQRNKFGGTWNGGQKDSLSKKKKTHHFALLGGLGDNLAAEVVAVGVLLREEVQERVLLEDVDPILVLRR